MVNLEKTLNRLLAEAQESGNANNEKMALIYIKKLIDSRLEEVNRTIEEDLRRTNKQ